MEAWGQAGREGGKEAGRQAGRERTVTGMLMKSWPLRVLMARKMLSWALYSMYAMPLERFVFLSVMSWMSLTVPAWLKNLKMSRSSAFRFRLQAKTVRVARSYTWGEQGCSGVSRGEGEVRGLLSRMTNCEV